MSDADGDFKRIQACGHFKYFTKETCRYHTNTNYTLRRSAFPLLTPSYKNNSVSNSKVIITSKTPQLA